MRRVAFTAGSGRGGTTLLNLILGSRPQSLALGEVFGLPKHLANGEPSPCRFCEDACPVWERGFAEGLVQRYWPRKGAKAALARLRPGGPGVYAELFERSGHDLLLDSSKSLDWIKNRLADRRDWRHATPYLVLITRDGRAVVNSFRRLRPKVPVEVHVHNWTERMVELERLFAAFDPERRVRVAYETLATHPEPTIRRICAVLGVPFEPAMLRYWEHEHHALGGNRGTQYLVHRHHHRADAEGDRRVAPDARRRRYYEAHDLGIALDERWRGEMAPADLATFESLAGRINATYAHGD